MTSEKILGLILILLNCTSIVAISFPTFVKIIILLLNVVMAVGFLYARDLLIEVSFLGIYILHVILAAYRFELLVLVILSTTFLLVVRDALHILIKGESSGISYIITWYLPVYMASITISLLDVYYQTLLPEIPVTILVLALILVLYPVTRFISFSSESTPQ